MVYRYGFLSHFQQYFSYIIEFYFINEVSQNIRRNHWLLDPVVYIFVEFNTELNLTLVKKDNLWLQKDKGFQIMLLIFNNTQSQTNWIVNDGIKYVLTWMGVKLASLITDCICKSNYHIITSMVSTPPYCFVLEI